jgi:hypothetical protein
LIRLFSSSYASPNWAMSRLLSYLRPKKVAPAPSDILNIPQIELRKPSHAKIAANHEQHPRDSNRLSAFPVGDFRNASSEDIHDVKCEVMVNWLHSQQEEKQWLSGEEEEGVLLKKSKGDYACVPASLVTDATMISDVVAQLNVKVSLQL